MPIVIGLGSGRCGSHSLAKLLNSQDQSVCFHEINPSCMKWSGSEQTALSLVNEFRSILGGGPRQLTIDFSVPKRDEPLSRLRFLDSVRLIGDVAFYYLPYVELLASLPADIRFPCLKRGKVATVDSFIEKVRLRRSRRELLAAWVHGLISGRKLKTHRNHWVEHDGSEWQRDRVWDKCHPKFPAPTLRGAVESYYDFYYTKADELAEEYPGQFKVFPIEDLNTDAGQRSIMEFCGVPGTPLLVPIRSNKGRAS